MMPKFTQQQLFGVMGHPITHSLSPVMHNAAFAHLAYPGVYQAFDVTDVAGALTGMQALNIQGLSVTIPHKTAVMDYLDDIDALSQDIGAVNTVVNKGGRLYGTNTDCDGAMAALKAKTDLAGKQVAVLGAGGAARAVGIGLQKEKAHVTLYNRSVETAVGLAEHLGSDIHPLADFSGRNVEVLINTTSVGMLPNIVEMPVPQSALNPDMVVMDVVYNPLHTSLLKAARLKGCVTIDGVAMFVHQGARQFELWTGMSAPVDVMHGAVLNALVDTE